MIYDVNHLIAAAFFGAVVGLCLGYLLHTLERRWAASRDAKALRDAIEAGNRKAKDQLADGLRRRGGGP